MRVVLAKDSSRKEVAEAALQWSAFGFIVCLALGAIDTGTRPAVGIIAGALSAIVAFGVILLIRRVAVGRL